MKRTDYDDRIVRQFLTEAPEDEEGEEPAEEPAEDTAEEAGEEPAEDTAEEAGETDEEADAEEADSQPEEGSVLDSEIEAVLIDYEQKAIDQAAADSETNENRLYESGIILLLEDEEPLIDIDTFASEVARLVKNYENLLDMESLLIDKASSFISDKYGEETAERFLDSLESKHSLNLEKETEQESAPLAVGALPGGAAGA